MVGGGIQKMVLFGKIPSLYYAKNSSNKQRETTVHYYFKTWSFNLKFQELWNFLQLQSQKPSSAMMKDRHRKGRLRVTSAAEDKFLRNCSPNKFFRVQVTDRLRESGLHSPIDAKKPLLKDTKKKRLAWAKKQWAMDIRPVEICSLVWWVQIRDFWF